MLPYETERSTSQTHYYKGYTEFYMWPQIQIRRQVLETYCQWQMDICDLLAGDKMFVFVLCCNWQEELV